MKKLLFLIVCLMAFLNLYSQSNYYWYEGVKYSLSNYNKMVFVEFSDTINNQTMLDSLINDTSLTVRYFGTSTITSFINPIDTAIVNRNFASLESRNEINIDKLLSKNFIEYVGSFFEKQGLTHGIASSFYVLLNDSSDYNKLDSLCSLS